MNIGEKTRAKKTMARTIRAIGFRFTGEGLS
jgi:hypothetical protein